MKTLLFTFILATSSTVFAALDRVEVTFRQGEEFQVFTVEKKNKIATITLKEKGVKEKSKKLNPVLASSLIEEANSILWTTQYRMPASVKKCSTYAELKIDKNKTQTICHEQPSGVGQTYGLLNRMDRLIKK